MTSLDELVVVWVGQEPAWDQFLVVKIGEWRLSQGMHASLPRDLQKGVHSEVTAVRAMAVVAMRTLYATCPELDPSGLERAALDDPNEHSRWLVLADWLDENGDAMDRHRAASLRHKYLPDVFDHPFHLPEIST